MLQLLQLLEIKTTRYDLYKCFVFKNIFQSSQSTYITKHRKKIMNRYEHRQFLTMFQNSSKTMTYIVYLLFNNNGHIHLHIHFSYRLHLRPSYYGVSTNHTHTTNTHKKTNIISCDNHVVFKKMSNTFE